MRKKHNNAEEQGTCTEQLHNKWEALFLDEKQKRKEKLRRQWKTLQAGGTCFLLVRPALWEPVVNVHVIAWHHPIEFWNRLWVYQLSFSHIVDPSEFQKTVGQILNRIQDVD
jgi:hypothetical protein